MAAAQPAIGRRSLRYVCPNLSRKDAKRIARRINGGTNGLADRQALHRRARRVARWLVPKP